MSPATTAGSARCGLSAVSKNRFATGSINALKAIIRTNINWAFQQNVYCLIEILLSTLEVAGGVLLLSLLILFLGLRHQLVNLISLRRRGGNVCLSDY